MTSRARAPEESRRRIIEAATAEFAEHGLAGARVERIARRAGVNKQLLYHHFGDKRHLFGEVLHRMVVETSALLASASTEPGDLARLLSAAGGDEQRWLRLLQWEALERGDGSLVREDERAEEMARFVALVRDAQAGGLLPADLDAPQLALALIALATFPYLLPQLSMLVTGLPIESSEFATGHRDFVASIMGHLTSAPATAP